MKKVTIKILRNVLIALLMIAIILTLITYYKDILLWLNKEVGKPPSKEAQKEYAKRTEFFYDEKFHNKDYDLNIINTNKRTEDAQTEPKGEIPVIKSEQIPSVPKEEMAVTWMGHSSILLQMNGLNILTDPVLSKYTSPYSFTGNKRFSEIPILPENLPEIDVVVISHSHYDHLDYPTIMKIDEKVGKYLVPLGAESFLESWGIDKDKIQNMAWWEEVTIDGTLFAFTPSHHFAGRRPLRRNLTWWGGYVIKDENHSFYYTGDGGYSGHFKEIYEKYGAIDLIMPDTGQYGERWPRSHMNPKQSLQAAEEVHASWVIPVHWGAFRISHHNWYDPGKLMTEYAKDSPVNASTPRIGETVLYREIDKYQEQWWEDVE